MKKKKSLKKYINKVKRNIVLRLVKEYEVHEEKR